MFGTSEKDHCPLLKKTCISNKCKMWIKLIGKNPQTGADFDDWNCSMVFLPILMIEIAQKERQTGAAVESLRNVVDKMLGNVQKALTAHSLAQLITNPVSPSRPPEPITEITDAKTDGGAG